MAAGPGTVTRIRARWRMAELTGSEGFVPGVFPSARQRSQVLRGAVHAGRSIDFANIYGARSGGHTDAASPHLFDNTLGRRVTMHSRYEYKVIDTGRDIERQLNELGAEGWRVVGLTTKKQLLIAPPAAIILMREVRSAARAA